MQYINISHKRIYTGIIYESSTETGSDHPIENILKEEGFWCTNIKNSTDIDFFILDYGKEVPINYIEISSSPKGNVTFPDGFRIEGSKDGKYWNIIHSEKMVDIGDSTLYSIDIPITSLRFIKLIVTKPKKIETKYYTEIGRFNAGISGIKSLTSSSASNEHDTKDLLDNRNDTFWQTRLLPKATREYLDIDLGATFHLNRIAISSTKISPNGFPENFSIEISNDKSTWTPFVEEKNFHAESSQRYTWDIDTIPARYLHIKMQGKMIGSGNHGIRLSELEIFAAPKNSLHTHNIGDISPHASVFQAGLVRLAQDGEESPTTAVQGNDSRLREATTIFKGIVQLSDDGDDKKGAAVQASDSRLKNATELKPGIVRLAKDMEYSADIVVQGNDSRLKEASEQNFGIMKLCPDGVNSELGVVRGNDTRLQKATVSSCGISRLAADGENNPDCVVQGNDNRLRDATTTFKGIAELAEDGEDKEGVVVQGNDKRLKDASTKSKGIVELAENGEDKKGVVVQGNDKRLKNATTISKGIVELAEDGEDKEGVAVQGDDKRLKDASTAIKGIMRFAEDGEDASLAAVQGSDKRLRDGTTTYKGIVELAEDGEDKEGFAVQGNDKRLKNASTASKGIVELAEDGEDKEGVAVQGNDKRLKDASTTSKGIVELAGDGEEKEGVAVQGNDKRLKEASTTIKGIMKFAENGENAPYTAVQGNDKRLRDATTTFKGIVELAEDGEDKEGVAVQGHDKRLRDATTTSKGIVELAEDGEDKEGVAVQGHDKRLKEATEESLGIIRIAKNGENRKGLVVQSDDSRLSDPRSSLPHSHDYAPLSHEFNSHSGTIKIIDNKDERLTGIVPPSDESAIIYAKNESIRHGAIGITGIANPLNEDSKNSYGIVGHSRFVGVRGQSNGNPEGKTRGCGILGVSRLGAGGVFASEQSYSLIADGYSKIDEYDDSLNLKGNGDALYVNGKSEFAGNLYIKNREKDNKSPINIVEMFEVDEDQFIVPGDLLVVSDKGNSILARAIEGYSTSIIGIVSDNPSVIINNSGAEKKIYPVALAGKALCRIDARERPVKSGDLIVTSNTPGCGMAGVIDSFNKIGSVIGKALDSLNEGIGLIPVFITHQ